MDGDINIPVVDTAALASRARRLARELKVIAAHTAHPPMTVMVAVSLEALAGTFDPQEGGPRLARVVPIRRRPSPG